MTILQLNSFVCRLPEDVRLLDPETFGTPWPNELISEHSDTPVLSFEKVGGVRACLASLRVQSIQSHGVALTGETSASCSSKVAGLLTFNGSQPDQLTCDISDTPVCCVGVMMAYVLIRPQKVQGEFYFK